MGLGTPTRVNQLPTCHSSPDTVPTLNRTDRDPESVHTARVSLGRSGPKYTKVDRSPEGVAPVPTLQTRSESDKNSPTYAPLTVDNSQVRRKVGVSATCTAYHAYNMLAMLRFRPTSDGRRKVWESGPKFSTGPKYSGRDRDATASNPNGIGW